ncbi:MAG: hypothetical protein K0S74_153 [Chlamydiales bacterium]|jgi:hypothetical protein|nr:hypothetical protein [Chlamydiales bacterium]
MVTTHPFLFKPGRWLGKGAIELSGIAEKLSFFTRWNVTKSKNGIISALQEIEIQGSSYKLDNQIELKFQTNSAFEITLNNKLLTNLIGKGMVDHEVIAWELKNPEQKVDGMEVYRLQADGQYLCHAEYVSPDQMRTIIDYTLWTKDDT